MRWEFMSKMQDDLNLWTWFSSFSSHSLFQNFWDLFEFWEHVNTCVISLIKNLPSVGMKASTLWNFNELNLLRALRFLVYDQVQGLNNEGQWWYPSKAYSRTSMVLAWGRCWQWDSVNLAMSLSLVLVWILYLIHWY
jgi:hypothetical protein